MFTAGDSREQIADRLRVSQLNRQSPRASALRFKVNQAFSPTPTVRKALATLRPRKSFVRQPVNNSVYADEQ
jgi:hypothetical protein